MTNRLYSAEEIARFQALVRQSEPDQCWAWTGSVVRHGRGIFWAGGRNRSAPRVAFEIAHGQQIDSSLFACHSCDNPNCVNPRHIWIGTPSANMEDCVRKNRHGRKGRFNTHCSRGHELTSQNTITQPSGYRVCRKCGAARSAASRQKTTVDEILRQRGEAA